MSINFFDSNCVSRARSVRFGICDPAPPPTLPAFLDEFNEENWIGIVVNRDGKEVDFYAIDACVEIFREDGTQESRCDGLLKFEKRLIFVELKAREGGQWLKKGREQLTATIEVFKRNHAVTEFDEILGQVCNSQRPQSHSGHATNIQKFYDDTGFVLRAEQTIAL